MPGKPASWKVKVNEFEFSFNEDDVAAIDVVQRSATTFNIITNNNSVNALLLKDEGKTARFEIEGEVFDTSVKDELDQVLDAMGLNTAAGKQVKDVKAPMPGLVLEVTVSEGQAIHAGEKLLILGAMKMENIITIPVDAVIKRVAVTAGAAVEKGQVLIELQ